MLVVNSSTYSWVEGKVGKAINWQPTCSINCGSINSRVDVDTFSINTPPMSIVVWVKPSVASFYTIIRGKGSASPACSGTSNSGYFGLDGRIWFNCSFENGISLGNITAGQWYFLAGSIDSSFRIIFYKNDQKVIDQAPSYRISQSGGGFRIATRNDAYMDYFNGIIDEVRIYNRALSAAEIKAIYDATK